MLLSARSIPGSASISWIESIKGSSKAQLSSHTTVCFAVSHSQSLHLQVKKSSLCMRAEGSPLDQPGLFPQVTSQSVPIRTSVCLVAHYIASTWKHKPINHKFHLCLRNRPWAVLPTETRSLASLQQAPCSQGSVPPLPACFSPAGSVPIQEAERGWQKSCFQTRLSRLAGWHLHIYLFIAALYLYYLKKSISWRKSCFSFEGYRGFW